MLQNFNRSYLLTPLSSVFISNCRLLCVQRKGKPKTNSRKILDHFEKSGQTANLDLFPTNLRRVTNKNHPQIYIANEQTGEQIANAVCQFYDKKVPFIELLPGPCILSKVLLNQLDMRTLVLIEGDGEFTDIQKRLQQAHSSKVHLNLFNSKWNHYNRMNDLIFEYCERREWHEDIVLQLFLCSQLEDIHRLNNDILLQTGLFSYGRAEIFTVMTPLDFMRLTAGPSSPYLLYTQLSCLFQILFEYEKLAEIPIGNFLPWQRLKPAFGGKIKYDTESLYLIRMLPKRNLFSLCNRDDLPRLQFFIYQCLFKRKAYIIPKLEKWIAGIGIDLITANFNRTSSMQFESVNEDNLLGNLTNEFHVFTESGSLTPLQMCALFQFFRQMPMYKNSCFHQQFEHFYASKSSKIIANAINNADQSIITSHDQQVM